MRRAAIVIVGAVMGVGLPASSSASTSPPDESIPLDDVDAVSITGVGHVTVTIGTPAELTISGPAAAVDQLDVTVDDGELEVEPATDATIELAPGETLEFHVTVEELADIEVSGAVTAQVVGVVGDELGVDVRDSAAATITDVDLEEFDADVSGTAMLVVAGSTDELELDARGAAGFDGTGLVAGSADVEARDSALVVVNVSGTLEADVRATAIVEHVGTPAETELDVRDAGEVRVATGTLLPPMSTVPTGSPVPTADAAGVTTVAEADEPSGPAVHEVSLAGRVFSPATLEVGVGDTVTWVNDDDTEHTVTANDGAFDSGTLAEGATFSFTFDTAGEFDYRCLFHDSMQGTVVVR
jgi:plastocyanin